MATLVSLPTMSLTAVADVKVSTGVLYVNGQSNDLSLGNTKLTSVPVSIKVKKGALGVKLSSSYLRLDAGSGTTESGVGDTNLKLSYR